MVADGTTQHMDRTLEAARQELAAAADDLERVTAELQSRTRLVERLEILADTLLDLLSAPVVVVDVDGRIAAVSRGGAAELPGLADSIGKPVGAVLPEQLAEEISAFVATAAASLDEASAPTTGGSAAGSTSADTEDIDGQRRAAGRRRAPGGEDGTRFVRLPDGSALVVL